MYIDFRYVIPLFLISIISLTVIPFVEFPLNDTWIYSRNVRIFLEENRWVCEGCTAAGLLVVVMGAVFSELFGFTFTNLRILTIIFAVGSILLTYVLSQKITRNNKLSFLSALLLLSNPIFFNISHVFMTDIFFLFFTILSVLLSYKWLENGKPKYLFAFLIVSSVNVLIRQLAILVPFSLVVFVLLQKRKDFNFKFFALNMIPFVIFLLYVASEYIRFGTFYRREFDPTSPIGISGSSIYFFWSSIVYAGLFFLPIAISGIKMLSKRYFALTFVAFVVIAILLNVFVAPNHPRAYSMPYLTNTLTKYGVGAITISGVSDKPLLFPDWVWLAVTILSFLSASVILHEIKSKLLAVKWEPSNYLLIVAVLFVLFALVRQGEYFDRYNLVLIPLLAPVFIQKISKSGFLQVASVIFVVMMFVIAFAGTYEYFEWNKTRWDIIDGLISKGVAKENINGGFEYCLYNFGMKYVYLYWKDAGLENFKDVRPHDWKFCPNDKYIISFSQMPDDLKNPEGLVVKEKIQYCMLNYCNDMFLLERIGGFVYKV